MPPLPKAGPGKPGKPGKKKKKTKEELEEERRQAEEAARLAEEGMLNVLTARGRSVMQHTCLRALQL